MGVLVLLLLLPLASYVYVSWALWSIAKKVGAPNPWIAWLPFVKVCYLPTIAKLPWWYFVAIILFIVPFVGPFIFLALIVWWFWLIAEARGKPGWWGILMAIPLVNLIVLGLLAWSD